MGTLVFWHMLIMSIKIFSVTMKDGFWTTQWESGQSEKSMQSLKEQPYTGGCTKRLEMLLSNCSSATQVVQAVRFSRMCIACISLREVGKKQSIQVQSLPNQNKEKSKQCITSCLHYFWQCTVHISSFFHPMQWVSQCLMKMTTDKAVHLLRQIIPMMFSICCGILFCQEFRSGIAHLWVCRQFVEAIQLRLLDVH